MTRVNAIVEGDVPGQGEAIHLTFRPDQTRLYRDGWIASERGEGRLMRKVNQKGWLFVLPVVLLVAFNALIPMMTVVNYSVQETFGDNVFFWHGLGWFEDILKSERFQAALGRQAFFTFMILIIEVPLGVIIALSMPRSGFWVPVCLVLMALPMLIPWNVVGAMWNIFTLPDIGLLGYFLNHVARHQLRHDPEPDRSLDHRHHHGCLALDLARGASGLRRASSRSPTPIIRRPRSTARPTGRSSAIFNSRR